MTCACEKKIKLKRKIENYICMAPNRFFVEEKNTFNGKNCNLVMNAAKKYYINQ